MGALAGLMLTMTMVNKEARKVGKAKVPHMLYDQVKWVVQAPPRHPTCSLSVTVSTRGYQDNNFKPPPATRRRETDMLTLADTRVYHIFKKLFLLFSKQVLPLLQGDSE